MKNLVGLNKRRRRLRQKIVLNDWTRTSRAKNDLLDEGILVNWIGNNKMINGHETHPKPEDHRK